VAAAYDQMAAAAAAAGITLIVVSGFRSDAEQAELFAAHPDPKWVAPPGTSLHRCATELDLGPESAYAWIDANGSRFGFVQRYSWEAWHMGFDRAPAPCSEAGDAVTGPGAVAAPADATLPSFVPPRFRGTLVDAGAKWNVPAALLAAQLMAESNFNPFAVSPAGAEGIAQFMPATAASYGLADPFDPVEAIDAQAHLMSDLIRQFGSPELALAAYNAGPAPVESCSCVPGIPETRAYVTRIMALLGGAGVLAVPTFEVRLIA
jgi:soluble lytic murein transglycosylase-like protein